MAPQKGKGGQKDKEKEKEKERKTTCVGCRKVFNKSEYCVICGSCNYWYHKTCSGMAEEVFKCVDQYYKENGSTFWSCQPCATYSKGITARLREMDKRLEGVERRQEEHDAKLDKVDKVDKHVEKLSREVQKNEEKVEDVVSRRERSMYEELRERELRRKNVVFHGIGELQKEKTTWEERVEWDKRSCLNVFKALDLDLTAEAIKFTRRLGEKGQEPRPLLAGFYTEIERAKLLKTSKNLENTVFKDVNVVPDLTKKQREEEADLKKEADKKNKNLSESDRSKNLQWAVVGPRGERRLTKVQAQQEGAWENRKGGRRESRGRGPLTGANRIDLPRTRQEKETSQQSSDARQISQASQASQHSQNSRKNISGAENVDMETGGEESEELEESEEEEEDEEDEQEECGGENRDGQEKGEKRKTTKRKDRSMEEGEGPPEKR